MTTRYTKAFKEQAIEKVLQRGHKTINSMADELNVNHHTLKNWLRPYDQRESMPKTLANKRPEDLGPEERFQLLMESSALPICQASCRFFFFPHGGNFLGEAR